MCLAKIPWKSKTHKISGEVLLADEVTSPRLSQLITHIKGLFSPPSLPVIKMWWTHLFLTWTQAHFHVPELEVERCEWWNLLNLLSMWVCQPTLLPLWSSRLLRGERKFQTKYGDIEWRNVLFLFFQALLESSKPPLCANSLFWLKPVFPWPVNKEIVQKKKLNYEGKDAKLDILKTAQLALTWLLIVMLER